MNEIRFVDTTLRDGQASLWAENMRTGMMLAVASEIDEAGFQAIELIASSHIKKCVRELHEDPWERLRLVAQRIKKTPLRAIGAERISAFELTPGSLVNLWMERLAANGMRQIRISDPANDPSGWRKAVHTARTVGLMPVVNLIFSVSPKHTDEYYARKAREAAALGVPYICLKDPGGLLTPERTQTLVPVIFQNINSIPLEIHAHCTTGLAPLCYLEAIKLGVRMVDTAIPPLANASSNPSVSNMAKNVRALGYTPDIDTEVVKPVTDRLTLIAKREGLPIGAPAEYDYYQYRHQVPGGMISNLRHQLRKLGMEHRLPQVLEESIQVRADLGYPIMVTPFSQFVGSQAAINVITGERYKEITDQVIQYAAGFWGEEAASEIDPNVKAHILSRPRARDYAHWEPPQPSLQEIRSRIGATSVGDDELLLWVIVGKDDVMAMRAAGPPKEYLSANQPLIVLLEELTRRKDHTQIHVQKPGLSLTLEKRGSP